MGAIIRDASASAWAILAVIRHAVFAVMLDVFHYSFSRRTRRHLLRHGSIAEPATVESGSEVATSS
jgi:hypothetical protein